MAIERSVRINVETGNAKSELNGLAKSLRDTDKAAEGSAAATDKAEKEYKSLGAAAAQSAKQQTTLTGALNRSSSATADVTSKVGGFGRSAGQASIQLQQFVGQVQGGVNPMIALSQQASDLGIVLGAPLIGSIVGIGAAIAVSLLPNVIGATEEIDALAGAAERIRALTKEWNDEIKGFDTSALQLDVNNSEVRIFNLRKQIESTQKSIDRFGEGGFESIQGGASTVQFLEGRLQDLRKQLVQEEADRASLQGQIELNNQAREREIDLTSRENIAALTDAIRDQANITGLSARQTALYRLEKEAANTADTQSIDVARSVINASFDKIEAYEREQDAIKKQEQEAARASAEAKRRADQSARQIESQQAANQNLVETLENQLVVALAKTDREAAILTATQRLNTLATQEQRDAVVELTGRLYDLRNAAQTYDQLKAKLDPIAALTASYLEVVKDVSDADLTAAQERELLTIATQRYSDALKEAQKQQILNAETEQSYFGAFQQGLTDSLLTSESSYDQIREAGRSAISDLSSSIADFISTGEGDFRSFASNVINELLRIQTQILLTEGLKESGGLGGIASSIGGSLGFGGSTETAEPSVDTGSALEGISFGDSASSFSESWLSSLDGVNSAVNDTFGNAIAQSNAFNESSNSAAESIGSSLVGSLVKMATQLVTNAVVGETVQSGATAAGVAAAQAMASAWAPAAAAVSLASFGANSPPAIAGMTAAYTSAQTLSSVGATFARGGVIGVSDMSNSVVSTPTKFAMGGTTGQLGEAGAEAILPLQRTAGGELGVKGTTGQMQTVNVSPPEVNVRVVNVAENPQDYLGSAQGEKQIVNIMSRNRSALGL